jgi:hypothetical protein
MKKSSKVITKIKDVSLFGNPEASIEDTEIKEIKKKSTDLFSMIGNFFKPSEWKQYRQYEKSMNFFMINRFMSINFPIQAAIMSRTGINGGYLVEFWKDVISSKFKTTPTWMYVRTKKVKDAKPKSDNNIDEFSVEVIETFKYINKCGDKEFNELKKRCPDRLFEELNKIHTMTKTYS